MTWFFAVSKLSAAAASQRELYTVRPNPGMLIGKVVNDYVESDLARRSYGSSFDE
jgi:hypothetical protein